MIALASAAASVFVLLVMLRAVTHKVLDFNELQGFVADYRVVPESRAATASAGVVVAEFAIVAAIALPATRPIGLLAATALLSGYGGLIALNLARGHRRIECGCGGAPQVLGAALIVRNAVLVLLALFAAATPARLESTAETVVVISSGLCLLALYVLFEQLNANRQYLKTSEARSS